MNYSCHISDRSPVLKQNRITAIASENNLPLISLVQSVSTSYSSVTHGFLIISNCRLESFSLSSFVYSIKVASYFAILP